MSEPDDLEGALEAYANRVTEEWRARANLSPLLVRVCTTDTEITDRARWDAYAVDVVALLTGGGLDVAATQTAGPDYRQSLQVTFVIPDEGLGTNYRVMLADIAKRHGIAPYNSWTEIPARMRLDKW